jgi:hypothetical protein
MASRPVWKEGDCWISLIVEGARLIDVECSLWHCHTIEADIHLNITTRRHYQH